MKRVLITGTNGRIGGMLMRELRTSGRYEVIATARNADSEKGIISMNLLDKGRIFELVRDVDAVVHMAAYIDPGEFEERVIPNNILGIYYIYEAMRKNKVPFMVNGSTNHVAGFYRNDEEITGDSPYRPDSFYGFSKCAAEIMGRLYHDKYGIRCINIRIGHYNREPLSPRKAKIWISPGDMLQLTECCIEAPRDVTFLNLFGTSANTSRYWPIEHLKGLIGYEPRDNGDKFLNDPSRIWPYKKDKQGNFADDSGYMGGDFVYRELEG